MNGTPRIDVSAVDADDASVSRTLAGAAHSKESTENGENGECAAGKLPSKSGALLGTCSAHVSVSQSCLK